MVMYSHRLRTLTRTVTLHLQLIDPLTVFGDLAWV